MITIDKGTLPLAVFGPQAMGCATVCFRHWHGRYMRRPFLFGFLLDRAGIGAMGLSAGLGLAAFGSLFLLRPHRAVAA